MSHPQRRRALLALTALGTLSLVVTACGGSALSPETVREANQGWYGGAGAPGDPGSTGQVPTGTAVPPGAVPGRSPESGTQPGRASAPTGGPTRPGTAGHGANSADGGVVARSCAGFRNGPGVDDRTITLGNAADISGPVPGLFVSAQQATKAYVAYFNATSDLCGRKLALKTYDARTDAGADMQAYQRMCADVFAAVGSMSAFDSGGARTAQGCGLPDLRSSAVTGERAACATCFGMLGTRADQAVNAAPDFVRRSYPQAAAKAALLYINAGAAAENARTQIAAANKRGMTIVYSAGIDTSEFNYGPYVQAMKSKGVRAVRFVGAYQQAARLAKAMQQGGLKADVYLLDPTAYNADYVKQAGQAGQGTVVFVPFVPFEEASTNKEMQLYLQWLHQVAPGAQPTFFGVFAWSAARQFVQQATALGGGLTRAALVARLRTVRGWTANGLHAPQPVGAKQAGDCYRFLQLRDGRWVPLGGTRYSCSGVTTVD